MPDRLIARRQIIQATVVVYRPGIGWNDKRKTSMNKNKIAQSLTAIVQGSVLAGATAMADTSVTQEAKSAANTTGQKIDSSMKSALGLWAIAPLPQK